MNVSEIRLANFLRLFKQFRDANPELPDRGMLKLFGEHLDLSPRYLSHVKVGRKPIGHATARQIEIATGKPPGWCDQRHDEPEPMSAAEAAFVEAALAVFRSQSDTAKDAMIETLRTHLDRKNRKG